MVDLQVTAQSYEIAPVKLSGDLFRNTFSNIRRERSASNYTGEQTGDFDRSWGVTF